MTKRNKRILQIVSISLASVIALFLLIIAGYVIYVAAQYYRIEDHLQLETVGAREECVQAGGEYTLVSYNLGFGAYSPDYDFFMDTGVMKDGTKVSGTYAKGRNKADVEKNVNGQIVLSKGLNADFYFLQETDERADRSYGIDMTARFRELCERVCRKLSYGEFVLSLSRSHRSDERGDSDPFPLPYRPRRAPLLSRNDEFYRQAV